MQLGSSLVLQSGRVELLEAALGLLRTRSSKRLQKAGSPSVGWRRMNAGDCTSDRLVEESDKEKLKAPALTDWWGRSDVQVESASYASLLRCCGNVKALQYGKRVHAQIVRAGYGGDRFLGNLLVQMYGKCGCLEDARTVFDRICQRNVFSWNIMIQAYAENGCVDDARSIFDKMPQRDVVSWTAMITAHVQNAGGKEALKLFRQMQLKGARPDKITFLSVLDACAGLADLAQGKETHADITDNGFESDVIVASALVNMYGKCGNVECARSVFDRMPERNVVSWTAMIAAYSQNGHGKEAIRLFQQMQLKSVQPNKITFMIILDACAGLAAVAEGKESHASIIHGGFESDVVVGTALVNMYGKCGSLDDARHVFDKITQRDSVSWTALIAAYSQNGHGKDALELFKQMQLEGMVPDKITFISILYACATLAALEEGKESHASIIESGFETDVVVGNALVNMYGKCGSLNDARHAFDSMAQLDVVSWNGMIAAYSQNGHGKEALDLFQQMQLKGIAPDMITFISILSGCSHAGLLDDGLHCFLSMNRDFAIMPTLDHLVCMIDLLGRAGRLDEAESLVNNAPLGNYAGAWMTLLGACRIHGDVDRGARAAECIFELDPHNAAPFVLLSNIYSAAGKWNDAAMVKKVMQDRGVLKKVGHSCVKVKNKVHEFVVGDTSHPQKEEIYAELQRLNRQMEDAGYMPDTKAVLCDAEEVNKENMLCYHSEKLAIAFGIISTLPGTPLCVTKNLRVCSDCHAASKFISKIVSRKIIVRDANRFHHFAHGVCSCEDYW